MPVQGVEDASRLGALLTEGVLELALWGVWVWYECVRGGLWEAGYVMWEAGYIMYVYGRTLRT